MIFFLFLKESIYIMISPNFASFDLVTAVLSFKSPQIFGSGSELL